MFRRVVCAALAIGLCAGSVFAQQSSAVQPAKHPKLLKAQKKIWTITPGVVASGSPASQGKRAALSADASSPSDLTQSIPNLGCPTQSLPQGVETVVAQGTMSAPGGTTSTWEATTQGSVVLKDALAGQILNDPHTAHIQGYIGVASNSCVDFASCTASLTPVVVGNIDTTNVNEVAIPFIQDFQGLQPTQTAVFFVTVTAESGQTPGTNTETTCVNASFLPLAHAQ